MRTRYDTNHLNRSAIRTEFSWASAEISFRHPFQAGDDVLEAVMLAEATDYAIRHISAAHRFPRRARMPRIGNGRARLIHGRLARLLATLMALQAGLPLLDFSGIRGKKREAYFAAVQSGMDRNYAPMEKIFRAVIVKTSG
jgi:hypothetical protein